MACLSRDSAGWRIRFYDVNGARRSIRLRKCSKRDAETVAHMVDRLITAQRLGAPLDSQTAGWLARISDSLHERLASVGLVEPRKTATLDELLEAFFTARSDVKPATSVVWGHVARDLRKFFGADCRLSEIDRDKAKAFRKHLIDRGLAPATITKRLQFARQFFAWGVEHRLLDANPFQGVKHQSGDPTAERWQYITREETQRLIDAAPDWVWRTIIALARYGGLRCPSEVLSLKWEDVDLPAGRMAIPSPKTEHIPGRSRRVAPITGWLRPYLEDAWDMAAEGQTHVIPEDRYLPSAKGPKGWVNCNLRTTMNKIIRRAGLEPWPKPFHNLRASCETDLATEFPIAAACQWIGNSPSIALRHYVRATNEDFERACRLGPKTGPVGARTVSQSDEDQNANPYFS